MNAIVAMKAGAAASPELLATGRLVIEIHRATQQVAERLSEECDRSLASRRDDPPDDADVVRRRLNGARYRYLRHLEDELSPHAESDAPVSDGEGSVSEALKRLARRLEALHRDDVGAKTARVAESVWLFRLCEASAPRLLEIQDALFKELKATKNAEESDGARSRLAARLASIRELVALAETDSARLLKLFEGTTEEIGALSEAEVEEHVGASFPTRRDEIKKSLSEFGAVGRFKRQLKKLEQSVAGVAAAPRETAVDEPLARLGAELKEIVARLRPSPAMKPPHPDGPSPPAAASSSSAPEQVAEQVAPAPADPQGLPEPAAGGAEAQSLRHTLEAIVSELSIRFEECRSAVAGHAAHDSAFRALLATVDSREAEMLHALGLRRVAGRTWRRMARSDPANIALLKNLAVCASYDEHPALALAAWRRYLEALYYYDALLSKPDLLAPRRRDLHEALGMALLPPELPALIYAEQSEAKPDEKALVALIERHSQARACFAHLLLKFFNSKLDYRSPLLVLGVDRGEADEVRAAAATKLRAWCEIVERFCDWPVFRRYLDCVRVHIADQLDICRVPAKLSQRRDPHFQEERRKHLEWLREVCRLKLRLRSLLLSREQAYLQFVSWPALISFINALLGLDEIPLDLSPSFLAEVALEFGEVGERQLTFGARFVGAILVHQKFGAKPLSEPGNLDERTYHRILTAWLASGLEGLEVPGSDLFDFLRFEAFLDDPGSLYHPRAQEIAAQATSYEPVIEYLKSWGAQYPCTITGPKRKAAELLMKEGKSEEAYALVKSAMERAKFAAGRDACRQLMKKLKAHEQIEAETYGDALPTLRELVEQDAEGNVDNLMQYLRTFSSEARSSNRDPGHEAMVRTVESWLQRFTKGIGVDEIHYIRESRDQALIIAFTAHLGDIDDPEVDQRSVIDAMTALLVAFPGVLDARVWRLRAGFQQAEFERDRGRENHARELLGNARQDASYLLAAEIDDAKRALVKKFVADMDALLEAGAGSLG
jgi:hypothetical protein